MCYNNVAESRTARRNNFGYKKTAAFVRRRRLFLYGLKNFKNDKCQYNDKYQFFDSHKAHLLSEGRTAGSLLWTLYHNHFKKSNQARLIRARVGHCCLLFPSSDFRLLFSFSVRVLIFWRFSDRM